MLPIVEEDLDGGLPMPGSGRKPEGGFPIVDP
jgi:hypothetical protein